MKHFLIMATILCTLTTQASPLHLSLGATGTPFGSNDGSLGIGVKHFFYQDYPPLELGANGMGLGLMSYKSKSVLASFTWLAVAPSPSWSIGVDVLVPILNKNDAPSGLLGVSINFAL